ncbi:MAG: hypothetical protein NTW85_06545 [Methylococcales bacterium]|nr:hypothetical protein [Methylococcales bacterium]
MKLQVPKGFTGDVHLHGRSFAVNDRDQVEIPDDLISSSLWGKGFTVVPPVQLKPIANNVSKAEA